MNMARRTKDETGAFAIMFGLLVTFLVVLAAFAVDIGNAVARKSDVQAQADFAALAGGRELGTSTSGTIPAAAVDAARDYLNNNSPLNKDCTTCVTSTELTDEDYANGEVLWAQDYAGGAGDPEFCGPSGLCVITPEEHVDYGLARIIGINGNDVQASATVGIFSPGNGPMPMYAVSGCDYGTQTMKDPAGGHVVSVANNLAFPGDRNDANISTTNPTQINVGQTSLITVTGSNFVDTNGNVANRRSVTKVGFFYNDGSTLHDALPTLAVTDTDAVVDIPTAVINTEGVWWVRVYKERTPPTAATSEWSPMGEAVPLRVGAPELECEAGASDGNFGTLTLPRQDINASSDDLAVNIADTLDDPLSLAVHATVAANGQCTAGVNGAVTSGDPNPGLNPGTNCVDTLTGLRSNDATKGFITGLNTSRGFIRGRLNAADNPTNPDCGRSDYSIALGNKSYSINNDTLSCFLTDGGTLASIMTGSYTGAARLSDDIYSSPRFFWLPVLKVEASSGGSGRYSIIAFRAGFITNETSAATKLSSDASGDNGFIVHSNLIEQVKVIFFADGALPSTTGGQVGDYLGYGPKIMRLID